MNGSTHCRLLFLCKQLACGQRHGSPYRTCNLSQVLHRLVNDHSPHVSGAATVYLLAIVQRCRSHLGLARHLPDIQAAFMSKLFARSVVLALDWVTAINPYSRVMRLCTRWCAR